MDVSQIPCPHCGVINEIIGSRTSGDYNPLCDNCQQPVREARKISFVGGNGRLYLQHIPGKGLGVYSRRGIKKGEIIERCPAYLLKSPLVVQALLGSLEMHPYSDSSVHLKGAHMALPWLNNKERCFALGYGMLYNHAKATDANLAYKPYTDPDTNRRYIDYTALKDIPADVELTQTYTVTSELWFDARAKK